MLLVLGVEQSDSVLTIYPYVYIYSFHIYIIYTFPDSFPFYVIQFSSVSRVRLFVTPWITARQASLSITNSWSLLKLKFIELVMPSSHLILCCTLLLLPSICPSIRVFSNESTLRMRGLKYWSFSFSISPPSEHPVLVSFRMDWLDLCYYKILNIVLCAVQ